MKERLKQEKKRKKEKEVKKYSKESTRSCWTSAVDGEKPRKGTRLEDLDRESECGGEDEGGRGMDRFFFQGTNPEAKFPVGCEFFFYLFPSLSFGFWID